MIFIIDLDHTLLNTSRLKKEMAKSIKKFGIKEKLWKETYQTTVKKVKKAFDYNVKLHSQLIFQKTGIKASLIEKEFKSVLKKCYKFLYPDTKPFLKYLKNKKVKIILLTLGNINWQKEKIKNLNLQKYFNKIIFTYWHKRFLKLNLDEPPENWIFINDNLKEIKELKDNFPQSLFLRIKRKGARNVYLKKDQIKVETFSNLTQIKSFLERRFFKSKNKYFS